MISATYGPNCNGQAGNATKSVAGVCDGKNSCTYKIEVAKLGDPAGGCAKSFIADFECLPGKTWQRREVPGEAGLGSEVDLSCSPRAADAAAPPPAIPAEGPPEDSGISIRFATYGLNCGGILGNATRGLGDACNGKGHCDYEIDVAKFGDPKAGCPKNFVAHYACARGEIGYVQTIAGEAGLGKHILVDCPAVPAGSVDLPDGVALEPSLQGIEIQTATYGGNCGGKPGNATVDLGASCNGKDNCDYIVDAARLGDPKRACAKDFTARYRCAPHDTAIARKLPGEAGMGSHLILNCAAPAQ